MIRSLLLAICTVIACACGSTSPGHTAAEPCCEITPPAVLPASGQGYTREFQTYELPAVTLLDQDGTAVTLAEALDPQQPVALNFVFTTCTTICPVLSASFATMQELLGPEADEIRWVSISLDPEYDRPAILESYAETWNAAPRWRFLTGDLADVQTVLAAFDALVGTKINHRPYTYFRLPGETRWMRVDGLASAADMVAELRWLRSGAAP